MPISLHYHQRKIPTESHGEADRGKAEQVRRTHGCGAGATERPEAHRRKNQFLKTQKICGWTLMDGRKNQFLKTYFFCFASQKKCIFKNACGELPSGTVGLQKNCIFKNGFFGQTVKQKKRIFKNGRKRERSVSSWSLRWMKRKLQ